MIGRMKAPKKLVSDMIGHNTINNSNKCSDCGADISGGWYLSPNKSEPYHRLCENCIKKR